MLEQWIFMVGATFGALAPIANPFSAAPVFASLTQRFPEGRRKQQARAAACYTAAVLLVSLFAGAMILTFFGITLPVLRIGGGLVVARIGFAMLNPEPEVRVSEADQEEAQRMEDIAFTPIAMPLLSGPGSIAITISMATEVGHAAEYLAVAVGIALVAVFSWVVLHYAGRVVRLFGVTGMNAMTRIMGLILVCIGIQFVVTGTLEGLTGDRVMQAIVDAVQRTSGQ
jgi:multiple antibiotic resistance protein